VTGRQPAVRLRRATASDADLLLDWANDPVTRAASFHPDPIDRSGHVRWLAARIASPATAFWIGETADGRPIGQVRIEIGADAVGEVSISTAPDARGSGFGAALLRAAVDETRETLPVERLLARVRLDNGASLALFRGAGFRERSRGTCFDVPCATFELEPGRR
jgi:RimJ/RimL family protein N-acetyltransferase